MWRCIQMVVAFWPNCIPYSIPISNSLGAAVAVLGRGWSGGTAWVERTFLARHVDFAFNCFIVRQVSAITHTHTHRHSWSLHSCGQFGTVVDLVGEFPLGWTSSSSPYPTPTAHPGIWIFSPLFGSLSCRIQNEKRDRRRLLSDIRASGGCTNYAKCNTWGSCQGMGVAQAPLQQIGSFN